MIDQETFQQWLGDPENPELIDRTFGQIEVNGIDPIEAAIAGVATDRGVPSAPTPARSTT
jgi:hypothetical protein